MAFTRSAFFVGIQQDTQKQAAVADDMNEVLKIRNFQILTFMSGNLPFKRHLPGYDSVLTTVGDTKGKDGRGSDRALQDASLFGCADSDREEGEREVGLVTCRPLVIAIDGNIGVGKTTLCSKLAGLGVSVYKETSNQEFLHLFYSDPVKGL